MHSCGQKGRGNGPQESRCWKGGREGGRELRVSDQAHWHLLQAEIRDSSSCTELSACFYGDLQDTDGFAVVM